MFQLSTVVSLTAAVYFYGGIIQHQCEERKRSLANIALLAMVRVPTNHFCINHLAIILKMEHFKEKRKSFIEIGNVYFRRATINNWIKLLAPDGVKQIIIDSLLYLSEKKNRSIFFCYYAQSYSFYMADKRKEW